MNSPQQPTSDPNREEPRAGCLTFVLFVGVSLWVIGATFIIHSAGWAATQFLVYENTPPPWFAWPLVSWGHALALTLPVVPLALFTRVPRLRATYRTWALAIAFVFALGVARVFPTTQTQPAALAQIVLSLACAIVLLAWARLRGRRVRLTWRSGVTLLALALVPIIVAPSLIWGALGSPLDSALDLLAGLCLGLFVGLLLELWLFQSLNAPPLSAGREIVFAGFAAGMTLVMLAGGFGFDGSQLLLLLALPPLGFAAAALSRWARMNGEGWLPVAALIGLAAAAPLTFFDPDELSIFLGSGEILSWALRAAATSLLLALGVGFVLWLLRNRLNMPRVGVSLGLAATTWLAGLLIYIFLGRPGFFGEELFVILREQADLAHSYSITNRDARTHFVYTTLTQHANRTQTRLRATLDAARIEYHPYYLVNALEVNGGPLVRAYLATQPEVDRILDSPHLRPLPAPIPISTGNQSAPIQPLWNITSIGADRVWTELRVTGMGIVVGQSDSGVQGDHPALRDGYRGRGGQDDYNWLDPWNHTRVPSDIGGHGTHTLGSILGRGGIGVAPDAEWFACVNLARNLGNPPVYLDCMQFMLAPYPQTGDPFKDGDPTKAAHVINNSWGCPPLEGCDATSLAPATNALRAAGIFVVGSAGNSGPRCGSVDSPLALYGDVFSVGAVDKRGELAIFSSRGPVSVDGSQRVKPDISAPGVDVLSAFPGNSYAIESGTSMAGPHVVGVVALMWSAQPKLIGDIDRTEKILKNTARPYIGERQGCFTGGAPGSGPGHPPQDFVPNNGAGYGIVDAYSAVQAALQER